jgi:hypothetical protein
MKKTLLATAIILALAATPTVFAKGGKPPPHEEMGNNLSFATKFVPNADNAPTLRLATNAMTNPGGPECTLFPGYFCQKTAATWQAPWTTGATADVTAGWGANLLGDAPLKAGRPIRVEMVLTELSSAPADGAANGFVVTNLTPELEDRLATYGTSGTTQSTDVVVFDDGAMLTIETCADEQCAAATSVVYDGPMTPEINSLGKVVYGYNWGTSGKTGAAQPGVYKLTYWANHSVIKGAPGAQTCAVAYNCTYVIITVTQSAGGGGGGRK